MSNDELDEILFDHRHTSKNTLKEQLLKWRDAHTQAEVERARVDELNALLDETEGGYPDGCEVVHDHTIINRIAELEKGE